MAKRFTDSEKWKDEWFLDLEPTMKIFWLYLLDTCDHAGIWRVNFKLASFSIGSILDKQSALKQLGDRISVVSDEYWFIEKFIKFQHPEGLSEGCKAHVGVIKALKYRGLETKGYLTVAKGYGNSTHTVQGKGKDQDQDKDKGKEKEKEEAAHGIIKSPDDLINAWNEMAPDFELPMAMLFLTNKSASNFIEISGYLETGNLTWECYLLRIVSSDFLMKKKKARPNLVWALDPDNFGKTMNGAFDEPEMNEEDVHKEFQKLMG